MSKELATEFNTENGQALTAVPALDIKEKSKKDMEADLERLRHNIIEMSKRHDKAFTEDEKAFIINRLRLLEHHYKVLRNSYNEKYDLMDLKDMARETSEGDDNDNSHQYNVDDPEVRKRIGYSLSYSCGGTYGYTQKETEALKELIPDIDEPVIF